MPGIGHEDFHLHDRRVQELREMLELPGERTTRKPLCVHRIYIS